MNADEARVAYAVSKLQEPERYYQEAKKRIAALATLGRTEIPCPREYQEVVGQRLAAEGYSIVGRDGSRMYGPELWIDWREGAKPGYRDSFYQKPDDVTGSRTEIPTLPLRRDPQMWLWGVAAVASIIFLITRL